MRKSVILWFILVGLLSFSAEAQNSRQVKALKAKQKELKQGLSKSSQELSKTEKDVSNKQKNLSFIEDQLENRLRYIRQLEDEMAKLDKQTAELQRQVVQAGRELDEKKRKYARSLRLARANRTVQSPLIFIFSARSFPQMYRRVRYAREYAAYQRVLGEQVVKKQGELLDRQNSLLEAKSEKSRLMREVMEQRMALHSQHAQQKEVMAGLKKKKKGLENRVAEQRKQLAELDKKIDQLIAQEVEQARKRAQEAAAKKAAAKRKAEQKAAAGKKTKAKGKSTPEPARKKDDGKQWITSEDHRLNGTFERNKGRLPVPITGSYMLGSRFGVYNVPGLKNVQLDNKGTNYIGRPGARARAIFDGEVTAVFQFGDTKNVLVRHGSYISVYCNLSSVIVSRGQRVHARDLLGAVADDGSGNCILHFQLRKETTKLNPEVWIGR